MSNSRYLQVLKIAFDFLIQIHTFTSLTIREIHLLVFHNWRCQIVTTVGKQASLQLTTPPLSPEIQPSLLREKKFVCGIEGRKNAISSSNNGDGNTEYDWKFTLFPLWRKFCFILNCMKSPCIVANAEKCMVIIERNVLKLYLCYCILERWFYRKLHIHTPCSKHLILFRALWRCRSMSRDPIFIHWYAIFMSKVTLPLAEHVEDKKARCCRCQGTAVEQSCEPRLWSWMVFFALVKWWNRPKKYCWELKCVKREHTVLL